MKTILFVLGILIATSTVYAQNDTPAYKKVPFVPAFSIQRADSSFFTNKDLPKRIPVVIVYFNPECGHCQAEAEELSKHMEQFKKVFFVMAAYNDMKLISEFAAKYGLDQYKNVVFGRDNKYFLPVFYHVETTPFSALYDKKGKLVTAFEHGMTSDDLSKALRR